MLSRYGQGVQDEDLHPDFLRATEDVWQHGGGCVLTVLTYKPFGEPVGAAGSEGFEYAGEMLVGAAGSSPGLYYIGARWMDPALGRWLLLDPELGKLSMPQTMNRYVYCVNNPLRFVDPTGEGFWSKLAKGIGDAIKDNWKTIVVVAVCIAVTVAVPGAGGILAGALVSGLVTGGVGAADVAMKGGGALQVLGAFGSGFAVGAATGLVGGAVGGKVLAPLAKSLFTGQAKLALSGIVGKTLGKLSAGLGKMSPSLGKMVDRLQSGIGNRLNPLLVTERAWERDVWVRGQGEVFDFITSDVLKGTGLRAALSSGITRAGMGINAAVAFGEEMTSELAGRTGSGLLSEYAD